MVALFQSTLPLSMYLGDASLDEVLPHLELVGPDYVSDNVELENDVADGVPVWGTRIVRTHDEFVRAAEDPGTSGLHIIYAGRDVTDLSVRDWLMGLSHCCGEVDQFQYEYDQVREELFRVMFRIRQDMIREGFDPINVPSHTKIWAQRVRQRPICQKRGEIAEQLSRAEARKRQMGFLVAPLLPRLRREQTRPGCIYRGALLRDISFRDYVFNGRNDSVVNLLHLGHNTFYDGFANFTNPRMPQKAWLYALNGCGRSKSHKEIRADRVVIEAPFEAVHDQVSWDLDDFTDPYPLVPVEALRGVSDVRLYYPVEDVGF